MGTRQHIEQLLNSKGFTLGKKMARELEASLEVPTSLRHMMNDNQVPQSLQVNDASASPKQDETCLDPADIDGEIHPGLTHAGSNKVTPVAPPWLVRRRGKKHQTQGNQRTCPR